ncbi:hypothetical protein HY404_03835 [Candidatus Microgenomates bacterium]|nr:hypothetical protein [Candidatus Microgenomates bacterium]
MSVENWRDRLREAAEHNKTFLDPEVRILQDLLQQYSLREYMKGMRDEIWQCGEIRELGGIVQSKDGTVVGKTAAVQLYWDYEDIEEVIERGYYDLGRSYDVHTGRFRPIQRSMYIVFGVARITVATPGVWESRLLPNGGYIDKFEIGDYFYETFNTTHSSSANKDIHWKYNGTDTTGTKMDLKLPQSPQLIREFIETTLLSLSNSVFLPSYRLEDVGRRRMDNR